MDRNAPWRRMQSIHRQRIRQRAWIERTRVAALADRILEADRALLRAGDGALTTQEAEALQRIVARLGAPP
jgi:thiamine pyrophosphate-dependent acetolactate synthase large subunit-like protein